MYDSGLWLVSTLCHGEDLHLLFFVGFYRRFQSGPNAFFTTTSILTFLQQDQLVIFSIAFGNRKNVFSVCCYFFLP